MNTNARQWTHKTTLTRKKLSPNYMDSILCFLSCYSKSLLCRDDKDISNNQKCDTFCKCRNNRLNNLLAFSTTIPFNYCMRIYIKLRRSNVLGRSNTRISENFPNCFRILFKKMKIADILLTLIFLALTIIGYFVWSIDNGVKELGKTTNSINDTLNQWFEASLWQEDLDYIINWLK